MCKLSFLVVILLSCWVAPSTTNDVEMYRDLLEKHFIFSVENTADNNVRLEPFRLVLESGDQAETVLLKILSDRPIWESAFRHFNAALALAFLGNNKGLPTLVDVCSGKGLEHGIITNSGFEISEAGLAILALGEPLPEGFSFGKTANSIYSFLDDQK